MAGAARITRTSEPTKQGFTQPAPRQPAVAEQQAIPPPAAAAPAAEQVPGRSAAPGSPIDLQLSDGRVVHMEKPEVACQFMVQRILAGAFPQSNGTAPLEAKIQAKALMYVKSIDGKLVTRPYDHVEAQVLMNQLGDEGMEFVANFYWQHFILGRADLPLSGR